MAGVEERNIHNLQTTGREVDSEHRPLGKHIEMTVTVWVWMSHQLFESEEIAVLPNLLLSTHQKPPKMS